MPRRTCFGFCFQSILALCLLCANSLKWLAPKGGRQGGPIMIKPMTYATKMGGNPMTITQATALRMRWNMRADLSTVCVHRNRELEWDDLGRSTGHYTCIICGEPILH